MRNYLIFNGYNSKDYGVYISGLNTFVGAERDVEVVSVAGRNGDLTIDKGRFKNVPITYPAFIYDKFDMNVSAFRGILLNSRGYQRLEDSYHPHEYRRARYMGPFDPDVVDWLKAGEFDITFDCDPRRFLKKGEEFISITTGCVIKNQTIFEAKPLIRVYGTGTITINGVSVVVNTANGYTDLDCELQEAYKGTTNCNGNITLTNGLFPVLASGNNTIIYSGFTQVDIKPNWWIL